MISKERVDAKTKYTEPSYKLGFYDGVRFAEAELKQTAMEFAEWCAINGWERSARRDRFEWHKEGSLTFNRPHEAAVSSELYQKFDAERLKV